MSVDNLFLVYNAKVWSPEGLNNDLSWFTFNVSTGYIIETGKDEKSVPVDKFPEAKRKNAKGRLYIYQQ